jgi:uncharacterized protein YgbK (DUF1537 family)
VSPKQTWILALADDLTGALEAGAVFANCGLRATVTTELTVGGVPETPVHVIDSETRHLSAAQAREIHESVAAQAARYGPALIYKKTDSTLRGNIHAELEGIAAAFPGRRVAFVPAYPAMRRTVRGGRLLVEGRPVEDTEFAHDPLNPVRDGDTRKLLGNICGEVWDGETEEDVLAAARAVLSERAQRIAAGPGALARALAAGCGTAARLPLRHSVRQCLIVNGSMHPASRAQIDHARAAGVFDEHWRLFEDFAAGGGTERAKAAGSLVYDRWRSEGFDALIVFGGDTAYGIHRAFGAHPFQPVGELVPGVPLSVSGGVTWVTKAGGFGTNDILSTMKRQLT